MNPESLTMSNVFLCEFSLVLDTKLNRRHIVFTDSNLPHRRRYLALKVCYYNNSDASYQLQRLLLSGDTGVSLNPGPPDYSYNDADEQPTQNSRSSIYACNGNSFLELPYKCLNIFHYNISSLTNKLDKIKLLLSSLSNQRKNRPNLIPGIAETFLNDSGSDASLAVERYTLFRADRLANKGGGLLVYVPEHLPISRGNDLKMPGIETIWLELRYPRSRPCLFSFVYRPPSADASFFKRMDSILAKVDCNNYRTCLLGDFNIDLFSKSALHKWFIALTKAYSFHQLITNATRPVSETLLDLVLVSNGDNVLKSGTLSLSLSDHLPIYVSLKSRAIKVQSEGHKPVFFRSKKFFSVNTFLADLECLPWSAMDMYSEPSEALSHWYTLIKSVLDSHAPLKKTPCQGEIHTRMVQQ